MSALHLLYRDSYAINDSIHISIPTVGQVLDNEDSYYNVVSAITAMPIDFMVQLDDLGIDFTTINAWQLFVLLFENIKQMDKYVLSLVFGDMDLSDFEIGISPQNGKFVIRDEKHDITIDRAIHSQMASVLRKLHHLEKNHRRPANDEAKDYMLRRAREKLKRHKDRKASTLYKAVGTTGAEIEALYIRNADGSLSQELTQASAAATGKFAYAPASKAITFHTDVTDGTEVVVYYKRRIKADVLNNESDVYSEKCTLYVDALGEDKCGNVYRIQFFIPKADFSGEFSLEMGENQTAHAFEAESLAGACGAGGSLWTYTVFGVNTADAE